MRALSSVGVQGLVRVLSCVADCGSGASRDASCEAVMKLIWGWSWKGVCGFGVLGGCSELKSS